MSTSQNPGSPDQQARFVQFNLGAIRPQSVGHFDKFDSLAAVAAAFAFYWGMSVAQGIGFAASVLPALIGVALGVGGIFMFYSSSSWKPGRRSMALIVLIVLIVVAVVSYRLGQSANPAAELQKVVSLGILGYILLVVLAAVFTWCVIAVGMKPGERPIRDTSNGFRTDPRHANGNGQYVVSDEPPPVATAPAPPIPTTPKDGTGMVYDRIPHPHPHDPANPAYVTDVPTAAPPPRN